ncbi:hypothetical protein [Nonomuraea sp. NPDC049684]
MLPAAACASVAAEPEDKENSTWLHEDDDVWGGDDDAVSGRIG